MDMQDVFYYNVSQDEQTKQWITPNDCYDTEEEAHQAEAPSQYLII